MLESQQAIEHAYFKEYQCYHFKHAKDVTVTREIQVNFRESSNADLDALPSALQDRLGGKEALYLLNWMHKGERWQLLIKELSDQKWINVLMSFLPSRVVISGGVLYMQACTQLAIVSLDKPYQDFRKLPEGEIVSISPCAVQHNEAQFEAGVAVVSFREENGYKLQHYSINRKVSERPHIRQLVQFLKNKKYLKFVHFQVIVPNLFALVFSNKSQFYLYDIQMGEIVENTKTRLLYSKLSTDEMPVVSWREHIRPAGFSKSLIVTIAVGNCIEIFFIYLKFRPEFEEQVAQAGLNDVHGGSIVEWAGTQLAPYLCLQTLGIVLDVGISKKGILYYSIEERNSQIGHCSYLDLNWALIESPILTQEATIWRRYYQDCQFAEFSDGNRFFLPNRYPSQLVLSLSQNLQYEQLRPILLNTWRSAFKFKGILVFSEEMLIMRSGSLSVFRLLPEDLFHFENFSQNQLNLLQQLECRAALSAREVENVFNKTESQYTEPLFRDAADRPILRQRRYTVVEQQDYGENDEAQKRAQVKFRKLQRELQLVMTERTQSMYATMSIAQFQLPLALSLLYDQLSYYHLTANSKAFRIQIQEQQQESEDYQLQCCIIRMINYFHGLLQRSEKHYLIFGDNLLAKFAAKHSQYISADIDRTVMTYLRLLMQNLFPIRTNNYAEDNYDHSIYNNPYIEFLIQELQKAIREGRSGQQSANGKAKLIREQLACILDVGFLDSSSIYFTRFWKNSSLFKAILLSNSQKLSAYLCQYLLKKDSSQLLHFYTELREFMTPQRVFIVENSLFFSQSFHSLPIDAQLLENGLRSPQDSEFDSYPQLVGMLKQEICSQNSLQRSGQTSKHATFVLKSIDALIEAEGFDQGQFYIIRQKLSTITISDPQEYLYFLERALKKCIHLFSCKVTIPEWSSITDQPTQQQTGLLKAKKAQLLDYLSLAKQSFLHYKRTYKRMYEQLTAEEEKQLQVSDVQREHVFEMIMMKERFIDPKEFHFQIEDGLGLICCSLTLKMLTDALDNFSDSLQVIQNLASFWLSSIRGAERGGKQDLEMAALTLDVVYGFAPDSMASYLKLDKEMKGSAVAIYQKTKYQSNYEFFNLFKDEAF